MIAVVLGLLLVAALVTIGVLSQRVTEARAEALELREALAAEQGTPRGPRAVQAAQAAGQAMRTVVETATRMRDQGVRGMLLSSIDDLAAWAMEDRKEIARIASPDGTWWARPSSIKTMAEWDCHSRQPATSRIGRRTPGTRRRPNRQASRPPVAQAQAAATAAEAAQMPN